MTSRKFEIRALCMMLFVGILPISGCTSLRNPTGSNPTNDNLNQPVGESVAAINFTRLAVYLPATPVGWTNETLFGATLILPIMGSDRGANRTWSQAYKKYVKDQTDVETTAYVGIMDSAFHMVGWWTVWNKGFIEFDTTTGYLHHTIVKGYPAYEAYDQNTNVYSVYIAVNKRILVFINSHNVDHDTFYNTFVNPIDYDGLAGLQ
ncbi:MAG: hypothetical protein HY832_01250 [Candidatus Aenigmarchaeota archaeon]|nr:hypothetical protein [Candidatus Aenigmarchaeota archaeon]